MNYESDNEPCTPPEIAEAAKLTSLGLLPQKSKDHYMSAYKNFLDWRIAKGINSFSESVLLVYLVAIVTEQKSIS